MLNVPSTPTRGTDVPPLTALSTTPKALVVSCFTMSPCANVTAPGSVRTTFEIAVNTCFDVITGDAGALVDLCRPSLSNQTTPPELKLPD